MRALKVPIECGEETCASKPGKFCSWLRTQRFGSEAICQIFSEWGYKRRIPLDFENGWTMRHPECLKMETKEVQ